MPSPLINATLQAAGLSAISNLLAQGIQAYQKGVRVPSTTSETLLIRSAGILLAEPRQARTIRPVYATYLPTELSLAAIPGGELPGILYRTRWVALPPQDQYCEEVCARPDSRGPCEYGGFCGILCRTQRQGQSSDPKNGPTCMLPASCLLYSNSQ